MEEDSEDEEADKLGEKHDFKSREKGNVRGSKKDSSSRKTKHAHIHEASEEGEVSSEDKEFDDGLDEDLMGNEEDRDYMDSLTEKQREEVRKCSTILTLHYYYLNIMLKNPELITAYVVFNRNYSNEPKIASSLRNDLKFKRNFENSRKRAI